MYIDSCTVGGYTRHLLRESYREGGKVKHRTIANLSHCSQEEIDAIRLALRHKDDLAELTSVSTAVSLKQGPSVGAAWLVFDLARQLGIADALGSTREGKLALWQVIARTIDQGSRLSAVRLAGSHAACDILGLDAFTEDHLYQNLEWLDKNQARIEDCLFKKRYPNGGPNLFLYDVTSSYLEGVCNELAAFGYNRDGKKGKRQIVIGLLCDDAGAPLSIEVFAGNTQDPATMASQIRKIAERFGGGEVTFVGDRGMIKSKQVQDLLDRGFHYITAITKPQIESLLKTGTFQMSLFDQEIAEVKTDDGVRHVLRRNPLRVQELQAQRRDKLSHLEKSARQKTRYLAEHPRATVRRALGEVRGLCERLKISQWVVVSASGRTISVEVDEAALAKESKLDGCYAITTDLPQEVAGKEEIHDRYRDLTLVEQAFRTCKTVELEMRPVNVRLGSHTRGHALVVMLSYLIVHELAKRWRGLNLKVEEGINELASLCAEEMLVNGKPSCNKIPEPRPMAKRLLLDARVRLPDVLPSRGIHVATRKSLVENRKSR